MLSLHASIGLNWFSEGGGTHLKCFPVPTHEFITWRL